MTIGIPLPVRRTARLPRIVVLALATAAAAARLPADEPAVRLAPVPASSGGEERVDPMRPDRLSASERERLYEQAARDAEHLEQQGRQLRRLVQLVQPTVVHIDATKPLQRLRGVDVDDGGLDELHQPPQLAALLLEVLGVAGRLLVEPLPLRGGEPVRPHRVDPLLAAGRRRHGRQPHGRLVGREAGGCGGRRQRQHDDPRQPGRPSHG